MPHNNHYNKNLKRYARRLRKHPTRAETVLWREALCQSKMMNYRFLRQRAISRYIVDFFSKELGLIIEVDGYSHQFEEVYKRDVIRQRELMALGYRFLRFDDHEVFYELNNVIRTIENWILDFEESNDRPALVRNSLNA